MTSTHANAMEPPTDRSSESRAMPTRSAPVRVERTGEGWRLTSRQFVPAPREEVFPFFADAHNLERITPDYLRFSVLTPRPIEMQGGARIEYRLRIRGVPVRWKTVIPVWEPPFRFVDRQVKGPYKQWVHEHTFEPVEGGTVLDDTVDYRVPGGPVAPIIERLFVRRDVVGIFEHRRRWIAEHFGGEG